MMAFTVAQYQVALGIAIFCIGVLGFLVRRNGIIVLMSLELMLNGVNLCLVTFSSYHGNPQGSSLFLFVVLVAAAEAALALSLFVTIFRRMKTVALDDFRILKG